ncbi:MAG: hypothetical protein E6Q97_10105 [Desulfurellales bacterium]|nr:MAG: hypothetical protein E6Q97_10105 [Desulfurellales bacterium]
MTSAISKRAFVNSQVAEVDLAISRVQEAARDSLQRIVDAGPLKGRQIDNVAVGVSAVSISHGLGRTPRGWFVVDRNAACDLHRTAWDARTITIISSATATVSIWVY